MISLPLPPDISSKLESKLKNFKSENELIDKLNNLKLDEQILFLEAIFNCPKDSYIQDHEKLTKKLCKIIDKNISKEESNENEISKIKKVFDKHFNKAQKYFPKNCAVEALGKRVEFSRAFLFSNSSHFETNKSRIDKIDLKKGLSLSCESNEAKEAILHYFRSGKIGPLNNQEARNEALKLAQDWKMEDLENQIVDAIVSNSYLFPPNLPKEFVKKIAHVQSESELIKELKQAKPQDQILFLKSIFEAPLNFSIDHEKLTGKLFSFINENIIENTLNANEKSQLKNLFENNNIALNNWVRSLNHPDAWDAALELVQDWGMKDLEKKITNQIVYRLSFLPQNLSKDLVKKFARVESKHDLIKELQEVKPIEQILFLKSIFESPGEFFKDHKELTELLCLFIDGNLIENKLNDEEKLKLKKFLDEHDLAYNYFPKSCVIENSERKITFSATFLILSSHYFDFAQKYTKQTSEDLIKEITIPSSSIAQEGLASYLENREVGKLVDQKAVEELLTFAHEWEIPDLQEQIIKNVELTPQNTVYILTYVQDSPNLHGHLERIAKKLLKFMEIEDLPELYKLASTKDYEVLKKVCQIFALTHYHSDHYDLVSPILGKLDSFPPKTLFDLPTKTLASLLKDFPSKFIILDLKGNSIEQINYLAQFFPPDLQSLKLANCKLENETLGLIAEKCPKLHILDLNNATSEKLDDKWPALSGFTELKMLDISRCIPAMLCINEMIPRNPKLKEFRMIRGPLVDDLGLGNTCCKLLGENCSRLEVLNLQGFGVTDSGLRYLYSNPKIKKGLTSLHLTTMKDINNISYFSNLKVLDLAGESFLTDSLLKEIVTGKMEPDKDSESVGLKNLEEFSLFKCRNISDESLKTLFENNARIKKIYLNSIGITDLGLQTIATNISGLTTLELLNCNFTGEGLIALVKANPNLKKLYLYNCKNVSKSVLKILKVDLGKVLIVKEEKQKSTKI